MRDVSTSTPQRLVVRGRIDDQMHRADDGAGIEVVQATACFGDIGELIHPRMAAALLVPNEFNAVYRHVLAVPGKRVRAGLTSACAELLASRARAPSTDVTGLACAIEMLHESSLIHDDICDGSLLRRGLPSVPAMFGVRLAARAGFYLAGVALDLLACVVADSPEAFGRLGKVRGVTYLDDLSRLSFGQLKETLPAACNDAALRRHYRLVVEAKTGTLFRLACSYGGTAGGVEDDGLRALMRYADHLAFAFQVMDDVRDVEGGSTLGKEAGGDLDRRIPTWPVIEWLASDPVSRSMWLTADTPTAAIQVELMRSGAAEASRSAAVGAAAAACEALESFPGTAARTYLRDLAVRVASR